MRNKFPLLYVMLIVDFMLGIAVLFVSTLLHLSLSDFLQGLCIGVAGTLILGGVALGVWYFMRKNKPCNI